MDDFPVQQTYVNDDDYMSDPDSLSANSSGYDDPADKDDSEEENSSSSDSDSNEGLPVAKFRPTFCVARARGGRVQARGRVRRPIPAAPAIAAVTNPGPRKMIPELEWNV